MRSTKTRKYFSGLWEYIIQWHQMWTMDGTKKKYAEWCNPDSERKTWYVFTHRGILDVKQKKKPNYIQSIVPEKLSNKEDTKREAWIVLGKRIRWDLLGNPRTSRAVEGRRWRMRTWGKKMVKLGERCCLRAM